MNNTKTLNEFESQVDIIVIFKEIKKRWILYALTMIIIMSGAYLYIKLAERKYKISSTLLINIRESSPESMDFLGAGGLNYFGSNTTFSNELLLFGSTPLIRKSIEKLEWEVSYFKKEFLSYRNIYGESPFKILVDENHLQIIDTDFKISFLDENTCYIEAKNEDVVLYNYKQSREVGKVGQIKINKKIKIGQKVEDKYYSFIILYNEKIKQPNLNKGNYSFRFNAIGRLTEATKIDMTVSPYDLESSVINIEFVHPSPRWAVDLIGSMTDEYMMLNLEKKNHAALQTIRYIDSQIGIIEDSLSTTESELQDYKMTHQIVDLVTQSRTAHEQLQNLENEKASLESRYEYYRYLNEYFDNATGKISDLIAPSAMGIEDPLLTGLIQELITYNAELTTLERNNQERSPRYQTLQIRIENVNNTIRENLKNIIKTSTISLNSLNDRISVLRREIQKLPGKTRDLSGLERKYNVNNEIFTFLLQRRAESEIARASSLPDNEIIEPAAIVGVASPKRMFIYAIAALLGLLIPSIPVVNILLFNRKIMNKKDLKRSSQVPFLGIIMHYEEIPGKIIFRDFPGSDVAESFRAVRTNLDFLVRPLESKVLLVTSTFSEEGKSFFSLNLAYALANSDKKVVVVDFDLRKPTIHKKLQLNNMLGVSNYLISQAILPDIIVKSELKNLDFIFCGDVPPNPNELIASEKTVELITTLRSEYEYIILDSAPVGLVTDAMYLMNLADKVFFVTRQGITDIDGYEQTVMEILPKYPNKIVSVLNDYKFTKANVDFYSYKSYGRSYKKYFQDKKKTGKITNVMDNMKKKKTIDKHSSSSSRN